MSLILNDDRIRALSNLQRWNGWTSRPYSVLEHSAIGARVLHEMGAPREVYRGFLLHDMHETDFCEITAPNKSRYVREEYHRDVLEWDIRMCHEIGEDVEILHGLTVRDMDIAMRDAEALTIVTSGYIPKDTGANHDMVNQAVTYILTQDYTKRCPVSLFREWMRK